MNEELQLEKLRRENEVLSQQVKRLIKAEGKLYQYQQELDEQLKEYKALYELSRRLSGNFDIHALFQLVFTGGVANNKALVAMLGRPTPIRSNPPKRSSASTRYSPRSPPAGRTSW